MSENKRPIPAEAVEAAAKKLYERDRALIVPWGDTALPDRRAYMDEARLVLEAAAPYMMVQSNVNQEVVRVAQAVAWDGGYFSNAYENPYAK